MIVGNIVGESLDAAISPIVAVFASLALAVVARRAPDRVAAAASITVACALGVTLYMAAKIALWMQLASGSYRPIQIKSFPFNVVIDLFFGVLVAIPIMLFVQRARVVALPVAIALAACMAILVVLGLRSLSRPAPDDVAVRSTSATVQPGGGTELGDLHVDYDATPETELADRRCVARVNGRAIEFAGYRFGCGQLTIRSEAGGGLVFVYGTDALPIAVLERSPGAIPKLVRMDDFVRRLGAPRGWVIGAVVLFALACVFIAVALRSRSRDVMAGIEARHEGEGWVRVGDQAPRFAPELAAVAPGPVVIFEAAKKSPTYRDDGAAKIFTTKVGTLATLRDERRSRVASWACVAIASLVMGSMPLMVARLNGLL